MLRSLSCSQGEQTPTLPPHFSASAANLRPGDISDNLQQNNTAVMSPPPPVFAKTWKQPDPTVRGGKNVRLESKWQICP